MLRSTANNSGNAVASPFAPQFVELAEYSPTKRRSLRFDTSNYFACSLIDILTENFSVLMVPDPARRFSALSFFISLTNAPR